MLAFASRFSKYIAVVAVFVLLLTLHLGSEPSGLSPAESTAKNGSQNIDSILNNPINAPHNSVLYISSFSGHANTMSARLSSVLWALLFIICFYLLCRAWFGKTISIMGTIMLITTPLFLIAGRQASAEIMFFFPIAIMAGYTWLIRSESKEIPLIVLATASSIFMYVPGAILWLVVSAIICRRKLIDALSETPKPVTTTALLVAILILVPLGLAVFKDPDLTKAIAPIPAQFQAPVEIIKNTGWMVSALFVKTPYHHILTIGRLPLINFIQLALLVFGLYAMWKAATRKCLALAASVIYGIMLAGLNNNLIYLALSLPAILVFATAGLRYLYIEWRSVFPRNPLAKTLALCLMSAVVVVYALFGIRYSLLAWPHTSDTKAAYVLK